MALPDEPEILADDVPLSAAESATLPRRLHDFSFPTSLVWGNQRVLRCSKRGGNVPAGEAYPSDGMPAVVPRLKRLRVLDPEEDEDEDDEVLKEVRKKLMAHFNVAVDKIQKAANKEEAATAAAAVKVEGKETAAAAAEGVPSRPWNLRTRRAACTAPLDNGQRRVHNPSPVAAEKFPAGTSSRFRSELPEKKEFPKFYHTLTREEIKEDLMKLFEGQPLKKPKKRPQKMQRMVDKVCPGMWLSEITADSYKIREGKSRGAG